MHRSGTSIVTRLLNLAGMFVGVPEMLGGEAKDNPTGFWEFSLFREVNDAILTRFGGSWARVPPLERGWEERGELADLYQDAGRAIQHFFCQPSFWGWKDPRASLTLPFWRQVLPEERYVICVRNPGEVAASLGGRNGITAAESHDLWQQYMLTSLAHTRGKPRAFVHFDSLFEDCESVLRRIGRELDLPTSDLTNHGQVREKLILPELRHHHAKPEEALSSGSLPPALELLYLALRSAGEDLPVDSGLPDYMAGSMHGNQIDGTVEGRKPFFTKIASRLRERDESMDRNRPLVQADAAQERKVSTYATDRRSAALTWKTVRAIFHAIPLTKSARAKLKRLFYAVYGKFYQCASHSRFYKEARRTWFRDEADRDSERSPSLETRVKSSV